MIIGITGHQRLEDPTAWKWVQDALDGILEENSGATGISSLAIGADQLFAESVLSHNLKLISVIPCLEYVETFDQTAVATYKSLLASAAEKIQLSFIAPSEKAFYAAGKKIADLADILVAVWDGQPAKGLGGTGDIVKYAQEQHKDIIHINPISREVVYIYAD